MSQQRPYSVCEYFSVSFVELVLHFIHLPKIKFEKDDFNGFSFMVLEGSIIKLLS